ncbi:hypothetical protein [Bowmanella denitrificans]|uniref:hypothetical protein n=1 Tax=Bowmanella denitrificans TaxID=366582 RepID=UPI000C9B7150|nr:hypothetical protein [Bowmanella denitrificans]
MAINPNNALDLRNVCYVAASGNGKGVAIQNMGLIPAKPFLAIFDPYGEYRWKDRKGGLGGRAVYHFTDRRSFARSFVTAWNSKKPFRLAYQPSGGTSRTELLWFCRLMWEASDGKRELHVLVEEMARMTETAGKEDSILGECYTGGRKFGQIWHAAFQRSSEIPKTVWSNSPFKAIGGQESMIDAERMAKELSCTVADVIELGKLNQDWAVNGKKTRLHYLLKRPGLGNFEKVAVSVRANKHLAKLIKPELKTDCWRGYKKLF